MGTNQEVESLSIIAKNLQKKYPYLKPDGTHRFQLGGLYEPCSDAQLATKTIAAIVIAQHWRRCKERSLIREKLRKYKQLREANFTTEAQ